MVEAAGEARSAGADLIVTFGGGSVTDAGKLVQLCLRHNVLDVDALDAFHRAAQRAIHDQNASALRFRQ